MRKKFLHRIWEVLLFFIGFIHEKKLKESDKVLWSADAPEEFSRDYGSGPFVVATIVEDKRSKIKNSQQQKFAYLRGKYGLLITHKIYNFPVKIPLQYLQRIKSSYLAEK